MLLPNQSSHYLPDLCLADPIAFAKRGLGGSASSISRADSLGLYAREFCVRRLVARFGATAQSALFRGIPHVVLLCAKKKVRWIYAKFIIAPMQNAQPNENFSDSQLIGNAMRPPMGLAVEGESSVTVAVTSAAPMPTLIRFDDFRPKSLAQGFHGASLAPYTGDGHH